MQDALSLRGRTVFVTGAGLVGTTIATTLAGHGAKAIAIVDIDGDRSAEAAKAIDAAGSRGFGVQADITDPAAVAAMAAEVKAELGSVDVVVNNAGLPPGLFDGTVSMLKKFVDCGPDDWRPWIRLGLEATMLVTGAFVKDMVDNGWGRVITIVSDSGRTGDPLLTGYAAAKAGSMGFMRSLASEVGPDGVTANCIALGTLWRQEGPQDGERVAKALKRYPVRRFGEPAEVAHFVSFLASEGAGWITGQVYPLNGGYSYAL